MIELALKPVGLCVDFLSKLEQRFVLRLRITRSDLPATAGAQP